MKIIAIIINAYSNLAHSLNQSYRLKEEFCKLGVGADILRNGGRALIDGGGNVVSPLTGYDCCVYLDKDKYLSSMLERAGMRLFNSHSAVEACDDKMTTFIALAGSGIPVPETIPAPLCYDADAHPSAAMLDFIEQRLGYPVVVKESYGSLGRGVHLANDRAQLEALAERLKLTPHLFQQFMAKSAGRDIRAIVIGGRCVAAMERKNDGDFRSNIELGGKGSAVQLSDEVMHICERAAGLLGLDYCGIDVLEGDGPALCEVNSNAFFGGIERVTGKNIAALYARHICDAIYKQ